MVDPSWTRERVIATVAEQFPPELRATVLSALDEYLGDTSTGSARVHLAILKIAGGELDKVRRYAAHANIDFRDILYMADHERPDGRSGTRSAD